MRFLAAFAKSLRQRVNLEEAVKALVLPSITVSFISGLIVGVLFRTPLLVALFTSLFLFFATMAAVLFAALLLMVAMEVLGGRSSFLRAVISVGYASSILALGGGLVLFLLAPAIPLVQGALRPLALVGFQTALMGFLFRLGLTTLLAILATLIGALTLVMTVAFLCRAVKELFETDLLTSFIGVGIAMGSLLFASYAILFPILFALGGFLG